LGRREHKSFSDDSETAGNTYLRLSRAVGLPG
jgi:hypothetical protein